MKMLPTYLHSFITYIKIYIYNSIHIKESYILYHRFKIFVDLSAGWQESDYRRVSDVRNSNAFVEDSFEEFNLDTITRKFPGKNWIKY